MTRRQSDNLFETLEDLNRENDLPCSNIIRVAFEAGVDSEFDYLVPDNLWPVNIGQRIEAPFGRSNKSKTGFCVELLPPVQPPQSPARKTFKLKKIRSVVDETPLIDQNLMALAMWISHYYICPLGQVLAAVIPAAVKKGIGVTSHKFLYLAQNFDQFTEKLKGHKQKHLIRLLKEQNALDPESAVDIDPLLQQVDCSFDVVKRLVEKTVIKINQKTIHKSLPVIPDGLNIQQKEIILNPDQQNAVTEISSAVNSNTFSVTVLHGVTDSGKTEVYIRAIEACIETGRSAIILLPEIALTTQTVQRFQSRFKKIAVMHSGLNAAQRNAQWQQVKAGLANVVIGARSAVFAPLANPGLIIVDEEHEPSFKQDTVPRYNARDVAIKRAQISNAHCILGSATPSLETIRNTQIKNHYNLISLPKRVMDLPLPEMQLVDIRQDEQTSKGHRLISSLLANHLRQILERKEQAILLLNRRGYSNFVFCPSCKHTLQCRNCDVSLTFHKSAAPRSPSLKTITGRHLTHGFSICHYCLAKTLVPENCPLCGSRMTMIGLGSQRLEEELSQSFPKARIARIDSDSMAGKNYYALLKSFSLGQIDILAGTQMLAKGLHFPNVTLVGIISADTSLYLPDFRANERTFQLISQVAGRAGRSVKKGKVFIQTLLPDQPAIQFALHNDYNGFVQEELKHRKACNLPPFWRMAAVILRDTSFEKLEHSARIMREKIDFFVRQYDLQILVRGPIPPPIARIQRFHRLHIILQSPSAETILKLFSHLRSTNSLNSPSKIAIDMDPINLL